MGKGERLAPIIQEKQSLPSLTKEQEELVASVDNFIVAAARRFRILPTVQNTEDLVQTGRLTAVKLVTNYQPEEGVFLNGSRKKRIKGAMIDSLRACGAIPEGLSRATAKINSIEKDGRKLSDEELSEATGRKIKEISLLRQAQKRMQLISIDDGEINGREEGNDVIAGSIPSTESTEESAIRNMQRAAITEAVMSLDPREMEIILQQQREGLETKKIAELHGISETRVNQLLTRIRENLRRYIEENYPEIAPQRKEVLKEVPPDFLALSDFLGLMGIDAVVYKNNHLGRGLELKRVAKGSRVYLSPEGQSRLRKRIEDLKQRRK